MSDPFTLPALPYAEDALVPVISAQTVNLHHSKHHQTYFTNLNGLVKGTSLAEKSLEDVVVASKKDPSLGKVFNNAGQAWNHILYWEQFSLSGDRMPSGKLKELVERDFGSFEQMKEQFAATTVGVFGSGWGWLVLDQGRLDIMGTSNADNPLAHGKTALAGIDVWEHAYYLDYQNRRPDHVKMVLDSAINWGYVRERLEQAL